MSKFIMQAVVAIAFQLAVLPAMAAEPDTIDNLRPSLGPNSCYWKTRNWNCSPL